jgi:tetratricopeptide (TPR) repeat protein
MKKLLILSVVLSAYSFGFGQSAMDFYEAGKDKQLQQDYRGAISDYTKAIGLDNNFTAAYESRAYCRSNLADFNGAIADISMAIKVEDLDSLKSDLYIYRGQLKEESGDYLGAMDDYGQAIEHFAAGGGHSFRGSLNQRYGLSERALVDLDEAIKKWPKGWNDYTMRGRAKLDLGDYKGAVLDFAISIKNNTFDSAGNFPVYINKTTAAQSFFHRGFAKSFLKDKIGALSDFDKSIELGLEDWRVYYYRGMFREELKNDVGALSDYSKAIELNDTIPNVFYRRGLVKVYLKSFNGALLDFSSAIRLDSDNSVCYFKRGEVKRLLEDFKGAIADYNSAISLDASALPSYYGRGVAKFMLSDFRGAIADINMALAFNKEFADEGLAYFVRGACKVNIGQKESGCLDFSKAGEMGVGDAYDFIREHCN